MTQMQAMATVINLTLGTGPFSYPQGFAKLGPILSSLLMALTTMISYMTATFMIEAISTANAMEMGSKRRKSIYSDRVYDSVVNGLEDETEDNKRSAFYIRQKVELGTLAEKVGRPWVKVFVMAIISFFMYGALCLKYVGGVQSLNAAIAFTFWGDKEGF